MQAYKGFDKDLKCRGFQYEIGKEYETDEAELCKSGFHACLLPLDCFRYYAPATSRYCLVELDDICEGDDNDDTKVCGKKIKIVKELTFTDMNTAAVDYFFDKVDKDNEASNSGDCSSASNSGDYSLASNSGYKSSASNSGDCSSASNSGDYSSASNSGSYSLASVSGAESVAFVTGYQSKAKACIGSAICIVERGEFDGNGYPLLAIKSAIIDGEILKADTWYTLKNGEFVEV